MTDSGRRLSVCVVRGAYTTDAALLEQVGQHAEVRLVDTIEEAEELANRNLVDLLLTDGGLLHAGARRFAPLPDVFENAGAVAQGLADGNGHFRWSNIKLDQFPDPVRERIRELCREAGEWAFGEFNTDLPSYQQGRRIAFEFEGRFFEGRLTPVRGDGGERLIGVVSWDATRTKRFYAKLDALDRAGEELVGFSDAQVSRLNATERLELLEKKIVRYTRELMQFDNFTVHLLDERTNKLELVLASGIPSGVREIPIYAALDGNGISGYVAARGKSYICADTATDPRYIEGIEEARSSLTVPLKLHDRVVGVFNVESNQPNAFDEDDRQFAEIFARHIAVALHILNLLISERHATTGQFAENVLAEVTGPVNDILTDVGSLLDENLGNDQLRSRLNQISDNAARMREAVRLMAQGGPGLIDRHRTRSGAVKHDPVLKGRRILVADDEEVIRETVCDVLRSYGCDIAEAASGNLAVEQAEANDFDLVLSDIRMPERSGYDVFAAAKERNKDCPVILMTGFGYDPNHSIVRARREGLAAVLFKPFKVEQLLGEIRTAIRSSPKK